MEIKITYIHLDTTMITLRLDNINCPILWNNKGQYGLIPFARIYNALENWKDRHFSIGLLPKGVFNWRDVIPVSPQIANALLGEDKDDKCTYRGKSSPTSG